LLLSGPIIATYERECRLLAHPCKCCCYQEIKVFDADGSSLGRFTEDFYLCPHLPQYTIFDQNDHPSYKVHPPVCAMCCVDICAEGLCNCRVPFYLYDLDKTGDHDDNDVRGKIVKVWAGLLNTFLDVHKFELEFPVNVDADEKARIVGATFLINEIYFHEEKKQNDNLLINNIISIT